MSTKVLVVDDDGGLRRLLMVKLEGDPRFTVVGEARDGEQALQLIETHDPDLVLLDLDMPRMDGLEVLATLQGRPRPVVVVLSGLADERDREGLRAAGAALCLVKDADLGDLPDRLATVTSPGASATADTPCATPAGTSVPGSPRR